MQRPRITRPRITIAAVAMAVASLVAATIGVAAGARAIAVVATPGTPASCPVTQPNGNLPPPGEHVFGRGPGGHGNDELWTNLWTWGEGAILVPPSHVNPDGSLGGMKWPWWRGIPGRLSIDGHRLDAAAPPLRAEIPDGYGASGFTPSGLLFPTPGCWEVTGRIDGASLTFVVQVATVNAAGTPVALTVGAATPSSGRATPPGS